MNVKDACKSKLKPVIKEAIQDFLMQYKDKFKLIDYENADGGEYYDRGLKLILEANFDIKNEFNNLDKNLKIEGRRIIINGEFWDNDFSYAKRVLDSILVINEPIPKLEKTKNKT